MKLSIQFATLMTLFAGACAVSSHPESRTPAPQHPDSNAEIASGSTNGPLWRVERGGFVPVTGSVASSILCQAVSLSLRIVKTAPEPAPPKLIGSPSRCANTSVYLGYLRSTLFVEGLDSAGARLFVATGSNPLHQDVEVPPPQTGGQFSWHAIDTSVPAINTVISAPLTPALRTLRWYDVNQSLQPHMLGDAEWTSR